MQVFAGTSGFSYPGWRGRFYPDALPDSHMLRFYSERLPTVEINNTFYRMPNADTVAAWRDGAPDSFLFAVKATRRITHQQKLENVADDVLHLFKVLEVLGPKLGPVLFQLPPFLKKDIDLLSAFLAVLPEGRRAALEFRHPSWFDDDVYRTLAARNVALVGGDLDEAEKSPPLVSTADVGYLRLRRLDYDPAGIAEWGARIAEQPWQSVYTYFKHEVLGPMFAEALLAVTSGREMADLSALRASIAAASSKPKSARTSKRGPRDSDSNGGDRDPASQPTASKVPVASKTSAPKSAKAAPSSGKSNKAGASVPASARTKTAPPRIAKAPAKPGKS
jgi:uncharacterized protein YecE (DUF72 family)